MMTESVKVISFSFPLKVPSHHRSRRRGGVQGSCRDGVGLRTRDLPFPLREQHLPPEQEVRHLQGDLAVHQEELGAFGQPADQAQQLQVHREAHDRRLLRCQLRLPICQGYPIRQKNDPPGTIH